jgi:hypothetical protein
MIVYSMKMNMNMKMKMPSSSSHLITFSIVIILVFFALCVAFNPVRVETEPKSIQSPMYLVSGYMKPETEYLDDDSSFKFYKK